MAPWTHTYLSPQTERRMCCASREPAQSFEQYIDTNTGTGGSSSSGGSSSTSTTGMNRPSTVPSQSGSTNDVVLFIGLLLLVILYLAYREYHRPRETRKDV